MDRADFAVLWWLDAAIITIYLAKLALDAHGGRVQVDVSPTQDAQLAYAQAGEQHLLNRVVVANARFDGAAHAGGEDTPGVLDCGGRLACLGHVREYVAHVNGEEDGELYFTEGVTHLFVDH